MALLSIGFMPKQRPNSLYRIYLMELVTDCVSLTNLYTLSNIVKVYTNKRTPVGPCRLYVSIGYIRLVNYKEV